MANKKISESLGGSEFFVVNLDPKANLIFKLIFEHENLLFSLLNALLPLDEIRRFD